MCIDEKIKEALYDKSYACPLCGAAFKSKAIKSGKNQLERIDDDLYAHYSLINPIYYGVIVCPRCGYSVLAKTLAPLLPKQKEWLHAQFTPDRPLATYSEYTTLEEAIHKHKMALLACITKKGKISEQAYIALLIAWLYRDMGDNTNERSFLERAYQGFNEAFSTEHFPMVGMDDCTVTYLLAAMARELDKIDSCKLYLSKVLTHSNCPPRIKDRALELKHKLTD